MPQRYDGLRTATVAGFCRMTGLGPTLVYQMLNDKRLLSITIGKRRLIVLDSWQRLMERQIGTPAGRPACPPPPRRRPRQTTAQAAAADGD
jgi:hypothetical protein